jgi:hypothetical protein
MSEDEQTPAEDLVVVRAEQKQLSHLGGFVAGGLAACGAVTVTNPIELIKTRYVVFRLVLISDVFMMRVPRRQASCGTCFAISSVGSGKNEFQSQRTIFV